jgi:hypothetical protein
MLSLLKRLSCCYRSKWPSRQAPWNNQSVSRNNRAPKIFLIFPNSGSDELETALRQLPGGHLKLPTRGRVKLPHPAWKESRPPLWRGSTRAPTQVPRRRSRSLPWHGDRPLHRAPFCRCKVFLMTSTSGAQSMRGMDRVIVSDPAKTLPAHAPSAATNNLVRRMIAPTWS